MAILPDQAERVTAEALPVTIVRYHEAAEQELLSEIGFLEAAAAGLGRRFFSAIQQGEDFVMKPTDSPRNRTRHS